jgi:hypothetical protein
MLEMGNVVMTRKELDEKLPNIDPWDKPVVYVNNKTAQRHFCYSAILNEWEIIAGVCVGDEDWADKVSEFPIEIKD